MFPLLIPSSRKITSLSRVFQKVSMRELESYRFLLNRLTHKSLLKVFYTRHLGTLGWISITCEDGYSQEVKYTVLKMKKTSLFQYAFRYLLFCQHFLPCSSLMSHHKLLTGWALWREESYELIITIKTTAPAAFYLYQKSVCFLQNRISGCS